MKYNTEKIEQFVETLDMPSWGYINKVEFDGEDIKITYCDSYTININTETRSLDNISCDENLAWGYWDVQFALNILDERDEILKMVED